jgi:hypothetical protein
MMPLNISMPYEQAVDVARSSAVLHEHDRARLLGYLAMWAPGLADRLLQHVIASDPELVATAMIDMNLAPAVPVPACVVGPEPVFEYVP